MSASSNPYEIDLNRNLANYAPLSPLGLLQRAAAVHPNYAKECGDEGFAEVESMLREGGFLAVGETGLDYYREYSPFDLQREFFRRHLALAEDLNLPVIIHCRDAWEDCLAILADSLPDAYPVVFHCFSDGPELLAPILKLDACGETGQEFVWVYRGEAEGP